LITGFVSYSLASKQLEQNALSSMQDTLSQTTYFLNNQLTSILNQLVSLKNDTSLIDLLSQVKNPDYQMQSEDYVDLNGKITKLFENSYSVLDSIFVYINNGQVSLLKKDYYSDAPTFPFSEYRNRYQGNVYDLYWENLHPNEWYHNKDQDAQVASIFNLIGRSDHDDVKGVISFQLKEKFFKDILNNPRISKNGYLLLASNDGVMQFKTVPPEYDIKAEMVSKLLKEENPQGSFHFQSADQVRMEVIYETLSINRWRIAVVFPREEIMERVTYIKYIIILVIAMLLLIAMLISSLAARLIAGPIMMLTNKVNRIEEGNLAIRFDFRAKNELGVLNNGLSSMLGRIRLLLLQVEEEQRKKRNAEMIALQAQIRPHFLYNTLFSIKQLCEMGNSKLASEMVTALSTFFRISISKGNEIIPLSEELEHVRNYLIIQKIRYDEDFEYEIEVEQHLLNVPIVKLTLQPLVENAIYHGVKKARRVGIVTIRCYAEEDGICLEVKDNGVGMTPDRLAHIRSALAEPDLESTPLGYGVRNVHRRLQLHYGAEYGLTYESTMSAGTRVTARFSRLDTEGGEQRVQNNDR
jgi:two-component system sensor histidine kinase YesM